MLQRVANVKIKQMESAICKKINYKYYHIILNIAHAKKYVNLKKKHLTNVVQLYILFIEYTKMH